MGVWIKRIHLSKVAKVKSQEQTKWLLLITFCLWTYSWAGIVIASDDVNGIGDWLTASDPAIKAALAVSAVFFTYGRLFPTSFFTEFLEIQQEDGTHRDERLESIEVACGSLVGIFIVIHNTGISAWNNYPITVTFGEGYELYWEHNDLPSSKDWDWKTVNQRQPNKFQGSIQLQATNVLALQNLRQLGSSWEPLLHWLKRKLRLRR